MTAEPDLLPCPFCGGTPVLRVPQLTDGYAVHIRCRCGVEMYGSRSHFATGGEAITAWNTRATAARDAELVELRSTIDALRTRLEDTVRDSTNKIEALRAEVKRLRGSLADSDAEIEFTYARAERADAEVDGLRAEVERLQSINSGLCRKSNYYLIDSARWQERAERLAEALRAFPAEPNPYTYRIAHAKARAALEQENDDA